MDVWAAYLGEFVAPVQIIWIVDTVIAFQTGAEINLASAEAINEAMGRFSFVKEA